MRKLEENTGDERKEGEKQLDTYKIEEDQKKIGQAQHQHGIGNGPNAQSEQVHLEGEIQDQHELKSTRNLDGNFIDRIDGHVLVEEDNKDREAINGFLTPDLNMSTRSNGIPLHP